MPPCRRDLMVCVLQLLALGFAGLLAGAALGAARLRAPRALVMTFLVLAGAAFALAMVLLIDGPGS